MKAIQISNTLRVMPIFLTERVTRMTPAGNEHSEMISCTIFDADTMEPLSQGFAFRAPEDPSDNVVGSRLALRRALNNSGLTDDERGKVWDVWRSIAFGKKRSNSDIIEQLKDNLRAAGLNVRFG